MKPTAAASSSSVSEMTLENYQFPTHRLRLQQEDSDRIPLVLVACGSFSPISILHLRIFEIAKDYARTNTQYEVVGGFLSPVSDAYKKSGLAPSHHRVRMCELATEESGDSDDWITVDPWEAIQPEYSPTAAVLDHFEHELNQVIGGVYTADGKTQRPAKIMLLAGADLIGTMSTPSIWNQKDLDHILGDFGTFVIERNGTDLKIALENLKTWEKNIVVVPQLVANDVSSTKIRLFLKRDMSVKWMTPHSVIRYIKQQRLYVDDADAASKNKILVTA